MRVISSISILITCMIQSISCDDCIVQVQQGQLSGQLVNTVIGNQQYYSFKGIPYAKPPTGELRFKAPEEPESWDEVRNATEHGNMCPQYNPITQVYTAGSEDCLFLNVYSPNLKPETLLPVLFFIHGGANMFGSGNSDLYGPDFLVNKNVIVVTINYRLGHLGFLSLGTKDVPGNAGLKDQVAALKWVQNNIEFFGGSPKNVTILGGTAGGVAVSYHILSPMSKGLFQRAISMSGTTSCDWSLSFEPVRRAFALGKMNGFKGQGTEELLAFLQETEIETIVKSSPTILTSEEKRNILAKMEPFSPVVEQDFGDNNFITEEPFEILKSGNVNEVDVMFGYNSLEALLLINLYNASYINDYYGIYPELFVPVQILFGITEKESLEVADKIISFYFGDKTVSVDNIAEFVRYSSHANIYHTQRFFRKWPAVGNSFFFKLSAYTSRNVYGQQGASYGIKGVSYFDEIFYLFNPESIDMPLIENTTEYEVVQKFTDAITNFAKYGNPSPDSSLGVTWPQYDNSSKAYVEFDIQLTAGYAPDEEHMKFWNDIFDSVGIEF